MPYARRFLPPTVGPARRPRAWLGAPPFDPNLAPRCPPGQKLVWDGRQSYCAQLPSTPTCPPGYKLVWNGYHHECWLLPNAPPPPQFQGAYFGDVVPPPMPPRIRLGGPTPTGLSYRPPYVSRIPIPPWHGPPLSYVPDEGDLDFTPYTPLMPQPAPLPEPPVFMPAPVPMPGLPVPVPHVPLPPVPVEVPVTEMLPPPPPMCPPPCEYYDAEELVRAWLCACQSSCP